MRIPFMIAAIALATVMATPASATTQAELTLSGFSYTLKDLNANDGVTPALSWNGSAWLNLYASEQQQLGWSTVTYGSWSTLTGDWNSGANATVSGAVSRLNLATPLGTGQASASGDGALSVSMSAGAGMRGHDSAQISRDFTLSPGSQVTFSYLVNGSLSGPGSTGSLVLPDGVGGVDGLSSASFSALLSIGSTSVQLSGSGTSSWLTASEAYETVVDGQTLQLTLRNTGAVAQAYSLNVSGSVFTSEAMAPVPEPSSYALMAAGLIAVGGIAKRRRR